MQGAAFYEPLLKIAWNALWDWAGPNSLLPSAIIIAVVSAVMSPLAINFFFRRGRPKTRVRQTVEEAVIGALAGPFLILLTIGLAKLLHAPYVVLGNAIRAADQSARNQERSIESTRYESRLKELQRRIEALQTQIRDERKAFDSEKKAFFVERAVLSKHRGGETGFGRWVSEPIPSNDPAAPYGLMVVIQPAKELTAPYEALVLCDHPLSSGTAGVAGPLSARQGLSADSKAYILKVRRPDLRLEDTVVFRLFSKTRVSVVDVGLR